MSGPGLAPPIASRLALETGWRAFWHQPLPMMLFTLLLGGLNLLCQLLIRHAGSAPPPPALGMALTLLAWGGYLVTNLWLLVGLLRGAERAITGQPNRLTALLRAEPAALLRAAGSLGLLVVLVVLVVWLAQASSWLMALLQPALVELPRLAGVAAITYLVTNQLLSLPIAVLGERGPVRAFRLGRAGLDPHWLQALGLSLLLGLMMLAGFLLLVVGLCVTLPLAACTLVAAYHQLFRPQRKLL